MTRWIVAGVLLAVLVVLIVSDEMGFNPAASSPELEVTPDAPPADMEIGEEPPPPDDPPDNEEEELARAEADEPCSAVNATLRSVGGDAYADEVGNALYETKGMTPDEVSALCKELEGASKDEIVARMAAETGVSP